MDEPIKIKVRVTQHGKCVWEIRAIAGGKFYKRQYVGYSKKQALEKFSEWLNDKI